MKLTDFKVLTFDCYGTLIDWESGLFEALKPWLDREGITAGREEVLETYAKCESGLQGTTGGTLYPEILSAAMKALADHWNITCTEGEAAAFGASIPQWPAFADSTAALRYLKDHYKLVILSNVDRQSFKGSNARLGVEFDAIITAQDVGSYKPDHRNFHVMLETLAPMGITKGQILHTAQSLFHDHVPATDLGFATAWIDRRRGMEGWGATMPPPRRVTTDFHVGSMSELVELHRAEVAGE